MRWGFNPRANCACAYHASFKEISKSEPVPSRVPFKLGLGMAWALQTSKSLIFLIEALRELTSLSLVIIHAMGPALSRIALVLDTQASRKFRSLGLGPPELQINYFLNRSFKGIEKSEPGASLNEIDKSEPGPPRASFKLGLGTSLIRTNQIDNI